MLGVFPATSPREIIRSAGMHPVEIWDPHLNNKTSSEHVQPFTCSIAETAVSFMKSDLVESCTGFLFPHTCDSLQNISSIISDFINNNSHVIHIYNPKHSDQEFARDYYGIQLEKLGDKLTSITKIDWRRRLPLVLEKEATVENLVIELLDYRSRRLLQASNVELFEVLRCIEYMSAADYSVLLENFINKRKCRKPIDSVGILLSGIMPVPAGLLAFLDKLGVSVVADDLMGVSRRIAAQPIEPAESPLEYLSRKYFNLPPCPTRGASIQGRISHVFQKIKCSNADGVMYLSMPMCEPELFDLPLIEENLKQNNLPCIKMEAGLDTKLSGQLITRIEAFVELLSG